MEKKNSRQRRMEIQTRIRVSSFQRTRIVTPVPIQRPFQRLPLSLLLEIRQLGQLCGFMEQRPPARPLFRITMITRRRAANPFPYNSHQLNGGAGFGTGVVVVKTDMSNRRRRIYSVGERNLGRGKGRDEKGLTSASGFSYTNRHPRP